MKMLFALCPGTFVWIVLLAFALKAEAAPPHANAAYTARPPQLDGRIDAVEWARTKPIFFPPEVAAPTANEVRFLWGKEGIYVAFQTIEHTPIFGHFKLGQPLYQEDTFEIFIDQKGDHRQWYELQINPAGQAFLKCYVFTAPPRLTPEKRLAQEYCDSQMWRYDVPIPPSLKVKSVLDRKTHRWTVEALIPAELVNRRRGGAPMVPCTWRVNLARHDWTQPPSVKNRKPSFQYWSPVLPGHPHLSPTLMGYLTLEKP